MPQWRSTTPKMYPIGGLSKVRRSASWLFQPQALYKGGSTNRLIFGHYYLSSHTSQLIIPPRCLFLPTVPPLFHPRRRSIDRRRNHVLIHFLGQMCLKNQPEVLSVGVPIVIPNFVWLSQYMENVIDLWSLPTKSSVSQKTLKKCLQLVP